MFKQQAFLFATIVFFVCILFGCSEKAENENNSFNATKGYKETVENPEKAYSEDLHIGASMLPSEIYEELLADYDTIISFYLSEDFEADYNAHKLPAYSKVLTDILSRADNDLRDHWHCMFVKLDSGLSSATKDSFGHELIDINNDQIPELFWTRDDGAVLAVFTVSNGTPVLLDAFWPRHSCERKGNLLYVSSSNGAAHEIFSVYSLQPGENVLFMETEFGVDGVDNKTNSEKYFEIVDGNRTSIDEDRYVFLTDWFRSVGQGQ